MPGRSRSLGPFAVGPHRLEFVDPKRDRRLEFVVTGDELRWTYGRTDGPWRQTTRRFPDLDAALRHVAARQRHVRARGYVEPGRNLQLEAEIARNPDDPGAYSVYADWLAARGDPLGELITVATALDERPGDLTLAAREQELLGANALSLADPRWRWRSLPVFYRFGFVEGWSFPFEIERAMKVGESAIKVGKGDFEPFGSLLRNPWWPLRDQLTAIRRHRCGIFVRRVYTQRRSYSIRAENDRWAITRIE